MWTYEQSTGKLIDHNNMLMAEGYSGAGPGKNVSEYQDVQNVGPIPQGRYVVEAPIDSPTHGPFALPLTPDPANEMFGRSEFLIHGDGLLDPGDASRGCIILPRFARERISESDDHMLQVVS